MNTRYFLIKNFKFILPFMCELEEPNDIEIYAIAKSNAIEVMVVAIDFSEFLRTPRLLLHYSVPPKISLFSPLFGGRIWE